MKLPFLFMFCLVFSLPVVFGEDIIMITKSADMEKVIFDGKWTNQPEWKASSWNQINSNDSIMHLRTAHQGDFIYVLVDAVNDVTVDKTDYAVVCLDGKNSKNVIADSDDYCFAVFPNFHSITYQGTSEESESFRIVANPDGFIGMSAESDENDRYSTIPHASYEFRIPIELFGRSDNYGFFVSVYDSDVQKFYSWPNLETDRDFTEIPPNRWGDIVSPDKSLPEFNMPMVIFFTIIGAIIFITKSYRKQNKLE